MTGKKITMTMGECKAVTKQLKAGVTPKSPERTAAEKLAEKLWSCFWTKGDIEAIEAALLEAKQEERERVIGLVRSVDSLENIPAMLTLIEGEK